MHIFPNISTSKGEQAKKFGQLIEYSNRNIFLQKSCKKWGSENSFRPLSVFQKWVKSKWLAAYFQYILIALNLAYIEK